jgi:uncharacterized protein (TIGR01244 family)
MKTIVSVVCLALALTACATSEPKPTLADLPALPSLAAPAPGTFTSGRLAQADVDAIQHSGVREVIDLTLDGETPDFDEAAAVRSRGMVYRNLPIEGAAGLTIENARAFDALLRSAQRPVLVHCSSGNRVGALAALRAAWVLGATTEEAVAVGKAWGLKGLEGEVRTRLATGPGGGRD